MKRKVVAALAAMFLVSNSVSIAQDTPLDEMTVWREFVTFLRSAPFPSERVRPYQEGLREAVLRYLAIIRAQARSEELRSTPEIFRVGQQIHYVLPLTLDGNVATYTFSFVLDGGRWFFQHLEAIQLRLDTIGSLPVSSFPDVPEATKAWIRAEQDATRDVWLYNTLVPEKGKDAALSWFRDGAGYALAAKSWVPFIAPERAFILYACWEQANLRGNGITLEVLTADAAVIRMASQWFKLYDVTAHLRQQIKLEDYRSLFEDRWRDRARAAGWIVSFAYLGSEVVLRFRRQSRGAASNQEAETRKESR